LAGDEETSFVKNALSFDLEDYFQVSAFAAGGGSERWAGRQSRLHSATAKLLGILAAHDCKATFFILGWVAEHYPEIVREIAREGHEIACHSHEHRRIFQMSRAEFRGDTIRAKSFLEDVSGSKIIGYRAPSFSITEDSFWAVEILAELGFGYDSSIFPIRHPNYGMPRAPRVPFRICTASGPIVEFPMPTVAVGQHRAPFGGGAYLRLLPYGYTRWAIRYVNQEEHQPVCLYLHPWELDVDQPRMSGSMTSRLRHYVGLRSAERKLRQLLRDFRFLPLNNLIRTTNYVQQNVSLV
jgi:polysaccharide deacetylase family protein (PEP-CTERM system associated)